MHPASPAETLQNMWPSFFVLLAYMPCRHQYIGGVDLMSNWACVTARQARARASPEAAKGPAAAALPEAGLGSPSL